MFLILWAAGPAFELPVVALVISPSPDVASDAAFGSAGSQVVALLSLALALVGVALDWKWPSVWPRRIVAALLWLTSGLLATLMLGYLTHGTQTGVAVLLGHSALATGVIGWALVRRVAAGQPSTLGR
ncbi:hypothetical protein Sar04_33400 [Salinispora arenicola]|uniref:Uncharacterized protein n=1 Tax=Salinispora arenicola TaxID=168697 RepID=A0ABQ4JXM5_SALAC|nr:hypothetical protein Sar04_33400 [Salinispora arenicola]